MATQAPTLNYLDEEQEKSGISIIPTHIAAKTALLPWDNFSQWVNAILVVTFDIEMGQSLESIYPSMKHVKLTPSEKLNICYMSFPDSNSGFLGDTQYHFRYCTSSALIESNSQANQAKNKSNDIFMAGGGGGGDSMLRKSHMPLNNPTHDQYNRRTFTGLEGIEYPQIFPL